MKRNRLSGFWALGLVAVLAGATAPRVAAQEFNCSVQVNYQNLTGSDYSFLQELREQVVEYMNKRNWTEVRYREFERIECTIQIIFTEAVTLTSFRARIVLATRRPIYGTTQTTTLVQFSDEDWRFNYSRGTPLIFDIDRFDALTSVLDFYAYLMLGYDYDSFSEFGGTPFFDQARLVAELARSSGAVGWAQLGGDRSRGELIAQLMDPRYRNLRKYYFDYHYTALDHFIDDVDRARAEVLAVLLGMSDLLEEVSRGYIIDLFFSAKYQELAAIFEESQAKGQAYDILTSLDPAHQSEYDRLVQ